eukprot:TRINITY_DN4727_c0_g3_i2.p1 TRINITY_DN4727_c0_g3~~TRINITY_DN4727_c0_g3_i2.p1  ORF type:complete len:171 (+),score=27.48 TRINITY_DN4727_c0_g3_i2:89-601(+)
MCIRDSYSSQPDIAYFPAKFSQPITLIAGQVNFFEMNVKSLSTDKQEVLVHLVDITTKELIHAWSVKIHTESPEVTTTFEVPVKVGVDSVQKFIYYNKTNYQSNFQFTSQAPQLLEIKDQKIGIKAGGRETIRFKVTGQQEEGTTNVFVFASDEDEKIFQCLLFKISYQR